MVAAPSLRPPPIPRPREPLTFEDTELVIIETTQGVEKTAEKLSSAKVLAVDTESDSLYSYKEKVCLIQISDLERDYIIDPIAGCKVDALLPVFADPAIPKVFHGADYDVVCLKRDFGFQTRHIFDTLVAAQMLGMEHKGLADLIQRFFGHTVDKQYQRHDWSRRPLLDVHLDYARGDTHWLPALREIMLRKLEAVGRVGHLVEECRLLEQRQWPTREFDPDGYVSLRGARALDDRALRVLRRLYLYRDQCGRDMDRPVFKVIPNDVLIRVATQQPRTNEELNRILGGKSALKRRHGKHLVTAVNQGIEDDFPIPKVKKSPRNKPKGPRPRLTGRQAERALTELKQWRNHLVDHHDSLTPYLVASNSTLKPIASRRPHDLEELRAVPEVRAWQVQDFGDQILEVLDRIDPPVESRG